MFRGTMLCHGLITLLIIYIFNNSVHANKEDVLFLTISSHGDWGYDSFIELNWEFSNFNPDSIGLFKNNPREGGNPFFVLKTNGLSKSNYTTDIPFKEINLPNNWQQDSKLNPTHGPQCLDLWIAAFKRDEIKHVNCLKIQPTWMEDMSAQIADIPMDQLFIPGTHDSSCYDSDPEKTYNLRAAKKVIFTQTMDIWKQLVFGVRYFDIRISEYTDAGNNITYWINHGPFKVLPFDIFVNSLKRFLTKAPNEVIIVDIHALPVGFSTDAEFKRLINYLETTLGDLMIPRDVRMSPKHGPTLNQILEYKTSRLIVCFAYDEYAKQTTNIWDLLSSNWGNVMKREDLKSYLMKANKNPVLLNNTNPFWAAGAELTADATYSVLSILSPDASYGDLGQMINKDITEWYRKYWCYSANIVGTDFILGNDIISVALNCNLERASLFKKSK